MHKVVLKGKHAVTAKCPACKLNHEVQANRHSHPMTLAFTHPKQCIPAKCVHCAKGFSWSPEELVAQAIAAGPSFTHKLEAEAAPAMA